MGLVFKWMKRNGGVSFFENRNIEKAKLFYDAMKGSRGFYQALVNEDSQSRVNIPFLVAHGDDEVQKKFVKQAKAKGLDGLAGHRYGLNSTFFCKIKDISLY